MIGKVLAHYLISEKLGEGGMGVVWKARDTHLDRFVALKTLPAEKLADPERRRRAVQEAKAASALNHPNIVHIYDSAEADGVQFIAMEYVPGKTLDQLIGRKSLRLNQILKYAVQIADAVAQAHLAGIIHRDLKPSNIIVADNGHVKVLDFGLAKLVETSTGEFAETATMKAHDGPSTEEGAIVGTVAYMSPEQAEGKKVDARSDIFSFGSMLYEMVTGRQAFHGDSLMSTLSAILKDEPKPVSAVVADTPRDVEKLIMRCLRKDPNRRYQTMADLKVALVELKEESESGRLTGIASEVVPARRKSRWIWVLAGTAVLLILAASIGLWFLRPRLHAAPKVIPLTSYPGSQINPAFSHDGKQVAFSWDGEKSDNFDIYVKLVDAGTPLRLTSNPAKEYAPAWSPDGRYIAFCRVLEEHSEIWMIPALGGPERRLGDSAECDGGIAWSPNGKFLVVPDKSIPASPLALYILSPQTGEKRRLTLPPNGYFGDGGPAFSPDGKTLAFERVRSLWNDAMYVLPMSESGEASAPPRRLAPDQQWINSADWTADGRSIVFASGQDGSTNLWTVPATGGMPERFVGGENAEDVSISRTGDRLVYSHNLFDTNIWRIPGPKSKGKDSAPTLLISSTKPDQEAQFSPDGKKIVFVSGRSGENALWLCDRDGLNPVQLTSSDISVVAPRWSPNSRQIIFNSTRAGTYDIYMISAEGGPVRRLTTGHSESRLPSFSRDGRSIYFCSNQTGDWQIWKVPAQGGTTVQVTKKGGSQAFESYDGNFVYYAKRATAGIWKVPVRGGEEVQVLDQGGLALWSLTDQGIYFGIMKESVGITGVVRHSHESAVIKFYPFATHRSETVTEFPTGTDIQLGSAAFSVSPDGQWIIFTRVDQGGSDLMLVENYR